MYLLKINVAALSMCVYTIQMLGHCYHAECGVLYTLPSAKGAGKLSIADNKSPPLLNVARNALAEKKEKRTVTPFLIKLIFKMSNVL